MTLDMVCNFRKCRRSLSSQAWVTTCSHAFCVEHGKREFKRNAENSLTCPACGNELRDKFDVIQADLHPNETFKSIVLAGMKPDTIMDIAMRAMSFWSYQVEQETLYQESLAKHTREKLQCLEEIHTLNLQKLKAELETCKRKIATMQTEYNKKRKQADELTSALEEKSRKLQKLTFQLEAQKRKGIHVPEEFESSNKNQSKCMDVSDLVGQRAVSEAFVFRPAKDTNAETHAICSPPRTPLFDFRRKKPHHQPNFQFRPLSS
ncbi:E3 ubiquitin-protein ligase CCNB1IP1-like [Plutella xylostella]|uniref:E3 ubiquitin-protein ligase CCNB1IP1-like n=1 Tax=Plutella xylostella TaxID=51655 RepID=UPI00203268A7|nr:E3 ubiquitin-protein ligase CCNB1IP1-like [Plutella xylostella]